MYGNSGRGTIRGPGSINFDIAALKDFRFRERFRVELRPEFFNATNTPTFLHGHSIVFGDDLQWHAGRTLYQQELWHAPDRYGHGTADPNRGEVRVLSPAGLFSSRLQPIASAAAVQQPERR